MYTNSARLTGLLLRFCGRYRIPVVKTNGGYEFDLRATRCVSRCGEAGCE